ncbi:MAG: hypothetical protein ACR2RD_06215 [Woeseiaceae bacterium]
MSENKGIRKFIIVSVLCLCPALVLADGKGDDGDRALTYWGVFFNDPSACLYSPCTDAEFFREGNPARLDVCYITGGNAAKFGWSAMGGAFAEGSNFGCIYSGLGLEDSEGTEIHFVGQKHGIARKYAPEILVDQITEFMGGCPPEPCLDIHFAIHVATGEFETVSDIYRFGDGSHVYGATSTLRRYEDGFKVGFSNYLHEGRDWYGMGGGLD